MAVEHKDNDRNWIVMVEVREVEDVDWRTRVLSGHKMDRERRDLATGSDQEICRGRRVDSTNGLRRCCHQE